MSQRYKIQYKEHEYTYTADDAEGAISKFCNRPVFGSPLAFSYRVLMIDADTRGREWCRAELNFGGREPRFAIIDAVRESGGV